MAEIQNYQVALSQQHSINLLKGGALNSGVSE